MTTQKIHSRFFPNGLEVVYQRSGAAPVISLDLWVRAGSTCERRGEEGIAHLLEHMLFKGTKKRGPGEIAREVENLGGEINAFTSFDHTAYTLLIASRYAPQGLDILTDAVSSSIFDPVELEREKLVVLEEIKRSRDIPQLKLSKNLFSLAYEGHPYGSPVIGSEESVSALTSDDLARFLARWYRPSNMVLVAVGDLTAERFFKLAERTLGALPKKPKPRQATLPKSLKQEALTFSAEKHSVGEIHFDLAFQAPGATHKDVAALDLLTTILGQGESSRLLERIKLEENLVATIGAGSYSPKGPGLLYIAAVSQQEKFTKAYAAICRELAVLTRELLPPEELKRAKETIEADFIYQRETVQGQGEKLGYFHIVYGGAQREEAYLREVNEVTPEKIRELAKKHLRPERASLALIHPEGTNAPISRRDALKTLAAALSKDNSERLDSGVINKRKPLPSGATVLIRRNPAVPIIAVRASMPGGLLGEPSGKEGAFHLLADCMTKGSLNRDVFEIARESDRLGGHVDGFTGRNSYGIKGEFLAKNAGEGLELISDLLLNTSIPEGELEKAKEDLLQAIKRREDNPASKAFRAFENLLYGEHPYGHDMLGTSASISALSRDDLLQIHEVHSNPSRIALSVVGDVDVDHTLHHLEGLFNGGAGPLTPLAEPAPPIAPESPRRLDLHSPHEQAHIVTGFLGTTLYDGEGMALRVINALLQGQGGRLFRALRDEQGLAYSVTALTIEGLHRGYIASYIATSPEKKELALAGLLGEMKKLARGEFTAMEVEQAKTKLAGSFELNLQENSFQAAQLSLDELYGVGYLNYLDFAKKALAVTVEEVEAVAKKYLGGDNWAAVIVGPDHKG
ncbi:MAG: insulinase family protein [Deltaproteobacteria bacterium]|nr:MAG: insulinase family protein [Deltaproteobacteria bacterium]